MKGETLTESRKEPSMMSYIRALEETLSNVSGGSMKSRALIEVAIDQVRGIRRHYRRLEEDRERLQEKVNRLEEVILEEGILLEEED